MPGSSLPRGHRSAPIRPSSARSPTSHSDDDSSTARTVSPQAKHLQKVSIIHAVKKRYAQEQRVYAARAAQQPIELLTIVAENDKLRMELERVQAAVAMLKIEQQQRFERTIKQQRESLGGLADNQAKEFASKMRRAMASEQHRYASLKEDCDNELARQRHACEAGLASTRAAKDAERAEAEQALREEHAMRLDAQRSALNAEHIGALRAVQSRLAREGAATAMTLCSSLVHVEAQIQHCVGAMNAAATRHAAETSAREEAMVTLRKRHAEALRAREDAMVAKQAEHAAALTERDGTHARALAASEEQHAKLQAERDATIASLRELLESGAASSAALVAAATAEAAAQLATQQAEFQTELITMRETAAQAEASGRATAEAQATQAEAALDAMRSQVADRDGRIATLLAERETALAAIRAQLAERDATIAKMRAGGRLRVHLSHAKNMRAADRNGKSDVYIILQHGRRSERSATIKKNINPTFDWDAVYACDSLDAALGERLVVEAWDEDEGISDNDLLGSGVLQLEPHRAALAQGQRVEVAVPLMHTAMLGKQKDAGEVIVVLNWEQKVPK